MEAQEKKYPDLTKADSLTVAKHTVRVLFDKLAKDIRLIHAANVSALTDYYIVAYARSATHCRALANELESNLGSCGIPPKHPEGLDAGEWILVDLGDVIVQLFTRDAGEFYRFERLFSEECFVPVADIVTEDQED